jgi:uncharacterized protein (TIGR03435 family)
MKRTLYLGVALVVGTPWALAQDSVSQTPKFEVAEIKPGAPGNGNSGMRLSKGALVTENSSLEECIEMAFRLRPYAVSGPSWLASARFDITAKLPPNAKDRDIGLMLQNLLIDRFSLATHRTVKEVNGYGLVVDKGGAKVTRATNNGSYGTSTGPGLIQGEGIPMNVLGEMISDVLGTPVKDLTGLDGGFDIKLRWTPEALGAGSGDAEPEIPLASALRDQLGLRLVRQKVPLEILVIDRIERTPTEN